MGRFYNGQISGKFWLGIQDSDDANHFGVKCQLLYYFYECGCEYERTACSKPIHKPENKETTETEETVFCDSCYSSYEEHHQAILEDEDIEREDTKTWYLSENEIFYQFLPEHLPKVEYYVRALEKEVAPYLESYILLEPSDENEPIRYSYSLPESLRSSLYDSKEHNLALLEKIARVCLGKQILHCLRTRHSCSFHADV